MNGCAKMERINLPRVAVANDLHVNGISGLVLEKSLDELLIHPVVKLAHPVPG